MSEARLTMREVSAQTGVEAPTLRMWEQRHGFPAPHRLPSGHRRYSSRDVELIRQLLRDREAGLELRAAIEKAKRAAATGAAEEDSIHAGLRRERPALEPYLLPKRALLSISHAMEDECGTNGAGAMLFASFQRESFYRSAEARWRDLAGPARCAIVLADFERVRESPGAPVEVPIRRADPVGREWSVICDAPRFTACLSGWERPGQDRVPDPERSFEVFWSVEAELVRKAALVASSIAARHAPRVIEQLREDLEQPIEAREVDLAALTSLTNRMVAYVGGGSATRLPAPRSS